MARAAVNTTPADHPARSVRLTGLGIVHKVRYELVWEPADIDEAIAAGREALELTLTSDRAYAACLTNLCDSLRVRFETGGELADIADIDEAIRLGRAAVDVTPTSHPNLPITLSNLGILAYYQQDWEAAWRSYLEALEHEQALRHLFGVGTTLVNLGEVAIEQGEAERACRLLASAERLLDEVRSSYISDATTLLVRAASAAGDPERVIENLRATVKGQCLDSLIAWAIQA